MTFYTSDLPQFEQALQFHIYLTDDFPTSYDAKIFYELSETTIDPSEFPNLFSWHSYLNNFTPEILSNWPDPAIKSLPEEKYELLDINNKPPRRIGKTLVIFEVKPINIELNLNTLARRIFKKVEYPGIE